MSCGSYLLNTNDTNTNDIYFQQPDPGIATKISYSIKYGKSRPLDL